MDDPEATRLILETLFDVRVVIYEVHDFLIDDEEEAEEDS